jgi:hypothetical protein
MNMLSPSPDPEAEFTARSDFPDIVEDFIQRLNNTHESQDEPYPARPISQEALTINNQGAAHAAGPSCAADCDTHQASIQPAPPHTPREDYRSNMINPAHQHRSNMDPLQPRSSVTNQRNSSPAAKRFTVARNGKENRSPETQRDPKNPAFATLPNTNTSHRKASRPKQKCYKLRNKPAPQLRAHTTAIPETETSPLSSLERERQRPLGKATQQQVKQHIRSRPKRRYLFGPGKHRHHEGSRKRARHSPDRGISPSPSPPPDSTPGPSTTPSRPQQSIEQKETPRGPPIASPAVRATLTLPRRSIRTPFDNYKGAQDYPPITP